MSSANRFNYQHKNKIAKKLNTVPVGDRKDKVQITIGVMKEVYDSSPFLIRGDVRARVYEHLIGLGFSADECSYCYRMASNMIMPMLESGENILRGFSMLDAVAREAEKNLYRDVYSDGVVVGEMFDSGAAGVVHKAVSSKLNLILKAQQNLLAASKLADDRERAGDSDNHLDEMDRDKLMRYVSGELIDRPEIVEKLLGVEEEVLLEVNSIVDEVRREQEEI